MIYFDLTKSSRAGHRSGLVRVSLRLREELGERAAPVSWADWDRSAGPSDWFLTAEIVSEDGFPGLDDFLRRRTCRSAAVFHDAIPLKFPHITWPRSVARHPGHLKLLASFDRVFANSEASRAELQGYWTWLGVQNPPPVGVLQLGSDFNRAARAVPGPSPSRPCLLCVGILEPRKNQAFLLDVCESLWAEGLEFDLHLVGRVNPHFGKSVLEKIRRLGRRRPFLRHLQGVDDAALAALYRSATASVFPTIAEGCGLPLLESLWMGVPCLASDLPSILENAAGGGCVPVPANDAPAWKAAIRRIVTDADFGARLRAEAGARLLPTWAEAAGRLAAALS